VVLKLFKWLLVILLLVAALPFVYFSGLGFYKGYDVVNAVGFFFSGNPDGTTIDEGKVPVRQHNVTWVGDIENHKLIEASGVAQSSVSPDVFFAINDSGNLPELFAMDSTGRDLGFWRIQVEENVDWEDMASFRYKGESYLLIADTGDNFRWRPSKELIIIREPDPDVRAMDAVIPVEWKIELEYSDGYRDCEAVAVDEKSESVLLLSKLVIPSEVWRVPVRPGQGKVTATRMALLNTIPQPNEQDMWESKRFGDTRSRPTALDIRDDTAVVFTYKDAYLYKRGWRENWIEAFSKIPVRIPLPPAHQQEAGLITRDKKHLYVTTEREDQTDRAGLYKVDL
jgi:hypothetical protein